MEVNEIVECPKYQMADYYTSAPYEYVHQFEGDPFKVKQVLQLMKMDASKLGIRCFIQMYDAYCKSLAGKQGFLAENSTSFENQPMELACGDYQCDENGIYLADGFRTTVCRHPIMPIQRLVNADSGDEKLKIAFRKGRNWRTLIADKSTIASSNSIINLAGQGVVVNNENAKQLSTYLLEMEQINYDSLPEQQSIGRLGWISEGKFSPYLDELEFDGEGNFKHVFNAVKPMGDLELWVDTMRSLRGEKTVARIFLAASFASVLLEPCGLLPFFCHGWGTTECGKTVGLMIATSVWASPRMGEYITTFNSTGVGMEMMASFLNSLPLAVDELQIQASQGIKDFDKVIYQLTEGIGKTRGAKTGGLQKVTTWKNCIITTGETPISNPNSGGGAVNRVLEFECVEKLYSDLPKLCDIIRQNYGLAGKEFVNFLQSIGTETIVKVQKEFYSELLRSDSTDKQAASASAILTADYFATRLFFQDDNALTVQDMMQFMTKKSDVDVNARAYEYITEFAVKNGNRFCPNGFGDYVGEVWGKYGKEHIYFIKSVFDKAMSDAGFNSTAFLSWAKRRGLLETESGRHTKKARIDNKLVWCVILKHPTNDETEW